MNTPLYREILAESWQMTKSRPWLWLFGLLALFLGNLGGVEIFLRVLYGGSPNLVWPDWQTLSEFVGLTDVQVGIWLFILLALLLVLAALASFVVITASGALILGVVQYHKGGPLNINQLWQRAAKKFLPLLGVVITFKILIFILTWLVGASLDLIGSGQAGTALVALFPLLWLLAAVAALVLSFLTIFAFAYILLKNKNFLEAVAASWQLFLNHWLISLEMAVILFVLSSLLGLAGLLGTVVIFVPVFFITIFSQNLVLLILGSFLAVVGLLLFSLLVFGLLTIFTTFQIGSFTLLFLRLEEGGAVSKIVRVVNRLWQTLRT